MLETCSQQTDILICDVIPGSAERLRERPYLFETEQLGSPPREVTLKQMWGDCGQREQQGLCDLWCSEVTGWSRGDTPSRMLDLSLRGEAAGGGWSASRAMTAQGGEQPVLSRHLPLSHPCPPLFWHQEICFHLGKTWPHHPPHRWCSQEVGPFPRGGKWGSILGVSNLTNEEMWLGFQRGNDDSEVGA